MQLRSIPISKLALDKEYLILYQPYARYEEEFSTLHKSTPRKVLSKVFNSYKAFLKGNQFKDSKKSIKLYLENCDSLNGDGYGFVEFYNI